MIRSTFIIALSFFAALLFSDTVNAQALNGNYTIDATQPTAGANFQSFTDFSNALTANGVDGNVTATVATGSGPYSEQVVFQNIAGLGASSTLTIEGNGETVTSDSALSVIGGNPDRYILRFINLHHVTVNNLRLEMFTGSTGFIGLHFVNPTVPGVAIHITNCIADMGVTTGTSLVGFVLNGTEDSHLTPGGLFDDVSVVGNYTTGGGFGVSIDGLDAPNLATNVLVDDNDFLNFNSNGVYLRETDGAIVRGNRFNKSTTNITTFNAIQLAQSGNINGRVYNNFIKVSQANNGSMTARGIYSFDGTGHRIFNNVIHDINLTSGDFVGIDIRNPGTEVYFNTISLDNTAPSNGNLIGIGESLSNTGTIIRNNIVSITQPTTGIKAALALGAISTISTAFNSNYNDFWIPDGNIAVKNLTTPTLYATLASWQSASTQDANSLNVDPEFLSAAQLLPTNPLIDNAGIAIAGIANDVIGTLRQDPPTIGAYEVPGCALPPTPTVLSIDSVVCENSTVTFSVNPVSGATSYAWEVPIDATVTSGQGTSEVTITFGTTSGNVVVFVNDTCGTSLPASFAVTVEICGGVDELMDANNMIVYPNPFTENALVELKLNKQNLNVRLLDHTGRVVKTFATNASRFSIDRDGLTNGVYFIEALSGESVVARKKIVVQ